MRKILLLALLPLALFAGRAADSCGFFDNNTFGSYVCPPYGDEKWQSEVTSIDPLGGNMVCTHRSTGNEVFTQTVKTGCGVPGIGSGQKLTDGTIDTAARNVLAVVKNLNPNTAEKADAYSTLTLRNMITETLDDLKGTKSLATRGVLDSLPPIDSHTNREGTVPAIITGVMTLDGDYFEHSGGKVHYINEVGEASINPEYIKLSKDNSILTGTLLTKIGSFFGTSASQIGTNNFSTFNPMAFMDLQVLGFYVYLSENLIAGYMDIVYLIFMMASVSAAGLYAYKKFFQKTAGQDFRVNKMTYVATAVSGFLFFTAPVITENVETTGAIANAIYKNGINDTSRNYGCSTLAQQTVRYAAQMGTYFGNLESDYAMQAFLALIRFKQGFFDDPVALQKSFEMRLQTIEGELTQASFYANFIDNVCTPYFGPGFENMSADQAANMKLTSGGDAQSQELAKTGMQAKRLSVTACTDAVRSLNTTSQKVIVAKKDFLNELETYENMYKQTGGSVIGKDVQENFKDFMQMMVWTQNTFGWMASITPHSSYLFFKNAHAFQYGTGILANNVSEDDRKNNAANGEAANAKQVGESTSLAEYATGSVESATGSVIGIFAENAPWFMVPGFSNIYSFVNDRLQSFSFKGGTGERTPLGDRIKGVVDDMLAIVTSIPVVGTIIAKLIYTFQTALGIDSYVKLQILITLVSFFVAMAITSMMIATVTVLVVTVFLAFKIVMYFVELIVFFMSVPVVGIYAALLSEEPQKYMETFGKNLAMLVITPLMIVTSSYLVLPISEFFKGLFSALVTLLFRIFDKGETELNMDYTGTNILDTISKLVALSSMQGVADIFAMISTIIISGIIIFNYKEWFTKLIGLDGVMDHTQGAYDEFKQKGEKYISPL